MESQDWIGSVAEGTYFMYADYMLLLTFGGIPWQVRNIPGYLTESGQFYYTTYYTNAD